MHSNTLKLDPNRTTLKSASEMAMVLAHTAENMFNSNAIAIQESLSEQADSVKLLEPAKNIHSLLKIEKNLSRDLIETSTSYWTDMYVNNIFNQLDYVGRAQKLAMQRLDDFEQKFEKGPAGSDLFKSMIRLALNVARFNFTTSVRFTEGICALAAENKPFEKTAPPEKMAPPKAHIKPHKGNAREKNVQAASSMR